MQMPRPRLDLEDQITLAEFVELWWADELPAAGFLEPGDEHSQFLLNKQSAVRMLRQKHEGFPAPVGSLGRSQLFRLGDLLNWEPLVSIAEIRARRDGGGLPTFEERAAKVAPLWHVRRAVRACARWLDATDADTQLRRITVSLALALHLTREATSVEGSFLYADLTSSGADVFALLDQAASLLEIAVPDLGPAIRILVDVPGRPSLDEHGADLDRLVLAIDGTLEAGLEPARLVEVLLHDMAPTRTRSGGSTVTASALTRLVLAVAQPQPDELVLDPASGEGNLLLAVADATDARAVLMGVEQDPVAWAIAVCRFAVRGLPIDLTLGTFPDDQAGQVRADLVLLDPPLESRKQYLGWLDLAEGSLEEGGRAVVVLAAVTLDTGRREWRLIGRDSASAAVETPSRLRADFGDALAIWLLERTPTQDLLFVDASHLGQRRDGLTYVSPDEADLVSECIRGWIADASLLAPPPLSVQVTPRSEVAKASTPSSDDRQATQEARDVPRPRDQPAVVLPDLSSFTSLQLRSPGPRRSSGRPGFHSSDGRRLSDPETLVALEEALELSEQLHTLIAGPLAPFVSEEQQRAIRRLIKRFRLIGPGSEGELDDVLLSEERGRRRPSPVPTKESVEIDGVTRFAIAWFRQHGYGFGSLADAEALAKTQTVTVDEVSRSGIGVNAEGEFRLLSYEEMEDPFEAGTESGARLWKLVRYLANDPTTSEGNAPMW